MPLDKYGRNKPIKETNRSSATAPAAVAAAPVPVVPTTPIPVTVSVPGADNWWKGVASPTSAQASMTNALLPFMSPEDQRTVGTNLSSLSEYSSYKNAPYPAAPSSITQEMKNKYLSSQRATGALAALENMRKITGKTEADLGPGYSFLKDAIGALQRLGGTDGGMSRAQYLEFKNTIDILTQQAKDNYDVQPYAALAQYFLSPTISSGSLMNEQTVMSPSGSTRKVFGKANKKLFG